MIKKQVTDKIVKFDGSWESVKDIANIVKNTKYNLKIVGILPNNTWDHIEFYLDNDSNHPKHYLYNNETYNNYFDYVIFRADGSINIVSKLPKCYQ